MRSAEEIQAMETASPAPHIEKTPELVGARAFDVMAEGQGFEPWSPGLPVKRFSRPPHSTALPPLRGMRPAAFPGMPSAPSGASQGSLEAYPRRKTTICNAPRGRGNNLAER